ncbi:unnamed protein product [Auanema sp. JU1783]|nr:unnamed protein product [Auanema sp. JU1783]
MRLFIFILSHILSFVLSEFCGNNKIPYGLEVHRDGHLTLLCSKPNCHEKKYAECPERPETDTCSGNDTWVGGLQKTVDGQVSLQCCQYELLEKYSEIIYDNVIVRRGEFYEGEEKLDLNDEDVIAFDLISNLQLSTDAKGEFYSLTIRRFYCGKIPDSSPQWLQANQWPYWDEQVAE